jgi:hypothetical protein
MLTGAADDGVAVTALAQCEDEVVDWRGIGAEKQFLAPHRSAAGASRVMTSGHPCA